jgi:hypothetical protein
MVLAFWGRWLRVLSHWRRGCVLQNLEGGLSSQGACISNSKLVEHTRRWCAERLSHVMWPDAMVPCVVLSVCLVA